MNTRFNGANVFTETKKKTVKIPTKNGSATGHANQITIIISVEIIKLIVIADGGTIFCYRRFPFFTE